MTKICSLLKKECVHDETLSVLHLLRPYTCQPQSEGIFLYTYILNIKYYKSNLWQQVG